MSPLYLNGISFWSSGFPDLVTFLHGTPDPSVADCQADWIHARLGRGASRLTRMLGHAAAKACADAEMDPAQVRTLYASDLGEIETMVLLLDTIFTSQEQPSPLRFKNSVHNAASGLGSIGSGNRAFSTALAGGERSFEASILEAVGLYAEEEGDLVIAIADDAAPAPFDRLLTRTALAVGFAISDRECARTLAVLDELQPIASGGPWPTTFAGRPLDAALSQHPAAAAFGLIEAVLTQEARTVSLCPGGEPTFSLRVRPSGRKLETAK